MIPRRDEGCSAFSLQGLSLCLCKRAKLVCLLHGFAGSEAHGPKLQKEPALRRRTDGHSALGADGERHLDCFSTYPQGCPSRELALAMDLRWHSQSRPKTCEDTGALRPVQPGCPGLELSGHHAEVRAVRPAKWLGTSRQQHWEPWLQT